jgi:hypothetical protein
VLDDVTRGLEAVTASPIGQWLVGAGLAFHGFIVWVGLATTGVVFLGNALIAMLAKFGLAEEGALAFSAIDFGAGLKLLAGSLVTAGAALIGFDTQQRSPRRWPRPGPGSWRRWAPLTRWCGSAWPWARWSSSASS